MQEKKVMYISKNDKGPNNESSYISFPVLFGFFIWGGGRGG